MYVYFFLDSGDSYGEIKLYWNENGIRFVVTHDPKASALFSKLFHNEQKKLQEELKEFNMSFSYPSTNLPVMRFQYDERPVNWLLTANVEERILLGKKLYDDVRKIDCYLEELLDAIVSSQPHQNDQIQGNNAHEILQTATMEED